MCYIWLVSLFGTKWNQQSRNIDFIKFIYERTNVHFGYDAVMGTHIDLLAAVRKICHAMPSHQTTIFGFCCVFPYLALIMVMEKNFSALLDFALLRFSTELYFMVKSRRREKLLIKALRMCVRMRNKKYVKTHAHTHSRRAIAMCYHIDLMKFYYLGPQLVDEITVFFVHPS